MQGLQCEWIYAICARKSVGFSMFFSIVILVNNESVNYGPIDLKLDWCLDFEVRKVLAKFCRSLRSNFCEQEIKENSIRDARTPQPREIFSTP